MRVIGIVVEVLGSALIVYGVFLFSTWLAIILGGLLLAAVGRTIRTSPQ